MSFFDRTLDNGLRVCLEVSPHMESAACGFLVRTGARDEQPEEEGVSHFLEHMCFKGTAKATWEQINRRFDELGSSYNAFTSHERTMYYGWVPADNLAPQIELLADMMRSTLPKHEFDTEKNVILEEIAMYRDSLESCMFDLASKQLFAGSPLALSVLGTEKTVGPLTRQQMLDYQSRRYGPENMVFVASGKLDPHAITEQVARLTADWPRGHGGREQPPPHMHRGLAKERNEKFKRQALMLCYPAPAGRDDDPRATVLTRVLSGANSRIFWQVIQRGICPDAGAFQLRFSDTGVFVLYGLCQPERADAVLEALRAQAAQISADGPTELEVERVCNQLRTAAARDTDVPVRRLMQLADDIDVLGRPLTVQQHLDKLKAVTVGDIREVVEQYPITGEGMLVSVGPADWPPSSA